VSLAVVRTGERKQRCWISLTATRTGYVALRGTANEAWARRPGLQARKRMSPPRPAVRTAERSMVGLFPFQRPPET
jgi:hypothetical protein